MVQGSALEEGAAWGSSQGWLCETAGKLFINVGVLFEKGSACTSVPGEKRKEHQSPLHTFHKIRQANLRHLSYFCFIFKFLFVL